MDNNRKSKCSFSIQICFIIESSKFSRNISCYPKLFITYLIQFTFPHQVISVQITFSKITQELSRSLMFKQKSQSYLCLSRSRFSIVINDFFQDAEMRQWICRDLPKLHFSHSASKNFRPKFQTGVSELCLSRNRFVL